MKTAGMRQLEKLIQARKQFQCIYAMPPWSESLAAGRNGPPGRIDFSELQRLPVKEVAADDAHLHIYVPNEWLPQAIGLLPAWGFRYASTLVIRSAQPAFTRYWRDAPAFLVLGICGTPSFGDNNIPGYIKTLPTNLTSLHELVGRVSRPPYLLLFGPESYYREEWVGVNG